MKYFKMTHLQQKHMQQKSMTMKIIAPTMIGKSRNLYILTVEKIIRKFLNSLKSKPNYYFQSIKLRTIFFNGRFQLGNRLKLQDTII